MGNVPVSSAFLLTTGFSEEEKYEKFAFVYIWSSPRLVLAIGAPTLILFLDDFNTVENTFGQKIFIEPYIRPRLHYAG